MKLRGKIKLARNEMSSDHIVYCRPLIPNLVEIILLPFGHDTRLLLNLRQCGVIVVINQRLCEGMLTLAGRRAGMAAVWGDLVTLFHSKLCDGRCHC